MEHFKILEDESTDDELVLEGYIALWGGKDLTGEHFTPETEFESSYTRKNAVLIDWEHGVEPDSVKEQPGRDDVLGTVDWLTARNDDIGLLARHVLDRREKYVSEFIEPLAKAHLLGSSSEAIPKNIQKEPNGHITDWPLKRQSFTVNPAETRLLNDNQMQVVKSLANDYPQLKSLLTDGKETVKNEKADNGKKIIENGDKIMADKEDGTVEDTKHQKANDERFGKIETALETIVGVLDKIPAPKKAATIIVEKDEADKKLEAHPHKFGLMLQGVKALATGRSLSPAQKAILGANEQVPAEGGFLVGTEQVNLVEKKMHDSAVFAGRTNNRTIGEGNNAVDFYGRKENSRVSGSRYGGIVGYRVAEGQDITKSQMEWYKYTLKPEKYAVLAYATDEIVSDAALLQAEILEAAPEELGFMLDDDIFNGSSAGYPEGIMNANCLVTVAKESGQAASTIVKDNIFKMWSRMWSRSKSNAVWFINQDTIPELMDIEVGSGGRLLYAPPSGEAMPNGSLFGRPVIETEFNATLGTVGDIVLADMSQYKLANKGGIQSASSMHVQFVTDQMVWRFTVRYDGQATWESALAPYKGTNTVSPFVALATRS